MNTFKGLSLTALLLAGSMSFIAPTQATTEAPTQALSQAPLEAPLATLTYDSPTVTTSPAPAPVEATTEAPTEALVEAPTEAPTQTTTEAPVEAIVEAPVEATTEQPTAAPTDPYSGNPIVDCEAQGLITAEDYTCASADFWNTAPEPEVAKGSAAEALALSGYDYEQFGKLYLGIEPVGPARPGYTVFPSVISPTIQYVFIKTQQEICANLELGEAWAGVGTFCQIGKTPEVVKPETPVTPETPAAD